MAKFTTLSTEAKKLSLFLRKSFEKSYFNKFAGMTGLTDYYFFNHHQSC